MTAILNVGLNVGDKRVHEHVCVLDVLEFMGLTVLDSVVRTSDTEPTVVAVINRPLSQQEGHALAVVLRQEAIAQFSNGKGKTFGPQAGRWVFNPKYFIKLDGYRLSETVK